MSIKKLIILIIISILSTTTALAESSTSFTVDVNDLNSGGNYGSSTNYTMNDTLPEFVNGKNASSSHFVLNTGVANLEQHCGNGIVELGEECDDGYHCSTGITCNKQSDCAGIGDNICKTRSNDGCSDICRIDTAPSTPTGGVTGGSGRLMPPAGESTQNIKAITIIAHPEKRPFDTDMFGVTATIKIYDRTSKELMASKNITLDNQGVAKMNADIPNGIYDVSIKGRSHLTRFSRNIKINKAITIDFTENGTRVLDSGDAQSEKDDFVNGLDFSAMSLVLYTADLDSDLNGDRMVNALDLSMAASNIYQSGETI